MTIRGIGVDHTNSDGVRRQYDSAALEVCEPGFNEPDTALNGYLSAELAAQRRPANDNRRTYRSVRSDKPYHCYNSTSWKYADVSVPRVSILEGAQMDGAQMEGFAA